MNKDEFEAWSEETARSKGCWMSDPIAESKGGWLFYRGGESGRFIMISSSGYLQVGLYDWAIPHIGEAVFSTKADRKYRNADEALQVVFDVLGSAFVEDFMNIKKGA